MNYKNKVSSSKDNIYNISFWGGIAWMFFISSFVYLAGFIITMLVNQPNLAKDVIAMVTIGEQTTSAVAGVFIIEFTSKLMVAALLIYAFRKTLRDDFIDFKNNFWKYIGYMVIAIVFAMILSEAVMRVYEVLGIEGQSQNQNIIEEALKTAVMPIGFLTVVFLAPILEELIFRKALFGLIEKKHNWGKFTAVIISTVLFAGIHVMSLENLKYIFQYIPLAFVMSYAYADTENIYIPISIHFINNLISFIYILGIIDV